ncbi:MAG: hypothetical protein LBQ75_00765 [Zoogloeaceae bacterium]|nr:hypothetical protein [Zoogloeaceae bacterium]
MKRMVGFLAALMLALGFSLAHAAEKLEGFDLGMTVAEAQKVIQQNKLKQSEEDTSEKGKLRRLYEGRVLGMDGGELKLLFKDGKLIFIEAILEGDAPEIQKYITQKHAEIEAKYRKLYGDTMESVFPGLQDWLLPDRLMSLAISRGQDGYFRLVVSTVRRDPQSMMSGN